MPMPPPGMHEPDKKPEEKASLAAPDDALTIGSAQPSVSMARTLERLREMRVEVHDLQDVLDEVSKGKIPLQTYAPYIQKAMRDIDVLMAGIQGTDSIRHLENSWEKMKVCPLLANPEGQFSPQEQLNYLGIINEQVRQITYQVGMLSIANRLNDWLSKARPGYYVPFHVVFEDEVPNLDDRVKILNFLALTPEVIKEGYVDADNGLVYRYSRYSWDRFTSIVLLIVAFALATLLVIGAAYVPIIGWPITGNDVGTLIGGWGALLVGVAVHLAVGNAKQKQNSSNLPRVVALGDLPIIINARLGPFLMKILMAMIGLFGLIFAAGMRQLTVFNAFLVGYSLDSVIELFSTSLEDRANAQVAAMKEQVQGKG